MGKKLEEIIIVCIHSTTMKTDWDDLFFNWSGGQSYCLGAKLDVNESQEECGRFCRAHDDPQENCK